MTWVQQCAAMPQLGGLGTAAGWSYVMASIAGEAIRAGR